MISMVNFITFINFILSINWKFIELFVFPELIFIMTGCLCFWLPRIGVIRNRLFDIVLVWFISHTCFDLWMHLCIFKYKCTIMVFLQSYSFIFLGNIIFFCLIYWSFKSLWFPNTNVYRIQNTTNYYIACSEDIPPKKQPLVTIKKWYQRFYLKYQKFNLKYPEFWLYIFLILSLLYLVLLTIWVYFF